MCEGMKLGMPADSNRTTIAMIGISARPSGSSGKMLHQLREQAEGGRSDFFAVHESLHDPVQAPTPVSRGGRFLGSTRRRGERPPVDRRYASLASAIAASPAAAAARVGGS
jgi:hypothetical protein